jgi:hypothetical protein
MVGIGYKERPREKKVKGKRRVGFAAKKNYE